MADNPARSRRADSPTNAIPSKKSKISESPLSSTDTSYTDLENSEILPSSDESLLNEDTRVSLLPPENDQTEIQDILKRQLAKKSRNNAEEKRENVKTTTLIQASLMGERAVYQELSLIGDGAYGTVYKAKDTTSGAVVALKKVRVPVTEDGLPSSTLREIAALKQLDCFDHPQIVKLLDVCQGNYFEESTLNGQGNQERRRDPGLTIWLVFEHIDHDLATFMANFKVHNIEPKLVKQISKEIIQGVDFLHSHRIIHRDLKPQNILINRNGHIKIADFGLAKTYDFEMRLTSVVVTLWYRAPEVLLGMPYATPIDIWAIGCILAELNRLSPLFPGTSEGDQLDKIFKIIGTPSEKDWPDKIPLSWSAFTFRHPVPLQFVIPNIDNMGIDLIKNMLLYNPHDRVTAAQALKHPYFSENMQN